MITNQLAKCVSKPNLLQKEETLSNNSKPSTRFKFKNWLRKLLELKLNWML